MFNFAQVGIMVEQLSSLLALRRPHIVGVTLESFEIVEPYYNYLLAVIKNRDNPIFRLRPHRL